ncbi:MAG TPA: FkbM family methyltransferase [Halomicronema sp.]
MANNQADCYWEYLKRTCPNLDSHSISLVVSFLEGTSWENPTSALDFNNFAVVALIEAEQCEDLSLRAIYLDMALDALNRGVQLYKNPLCAAHLALVKAMTGEMYTSAHLAFNTFVEILQPAFAGTEKLLPGIVYLPSVSSSLKNADSELIIQLLNAEEGYAQSLLLLSEALCRSQLAFYTGVSLRALHLASHIFSSSISLNLKLGISSLVNSQEEGLFYLHRARLLSTDAPPILQALYLAYRDLKQKHLANFWLGIAQQKLQKNPESLDLQWAKLNGDSPLTYVAFDQNLVLAVEPSFRSYVTSVLLAEGDWFEKEMEFWRSSIKHGMTVIDVGANVGVYTFSAAQRVGSQGRVLAVEPFSGCVRCLEESCRINNISWVKVCAGAASDREGTVRLSLFSASELNEVTTKESSPNMPPGSFEDVRCFTLDSLIDEENLSRVDFLKIDAEGHEMSVLAGSERILSQFSPVILYENIAGSKGSNTAVAEFLQLRGYKLFTYRGYVRDLKALDSAMDMAATLNIIAIRGSSI